MIGGNAYCGDIGQQINAAIGLLRSANVDLMKNHLICCGTGALSSKDSKKSTQFVEEFARIWDVSMRKLFYIFFMITSYIQRQDDS